MISSESDTIGICNSLRQCFSVLKFPEMGLIFFYKSVLFNRDIIIKYSGESDGKSIFFLDHLSQINLRMEKVCRQRGF